MAERKKHTAFWKRMKAANSRPIYAYARKHDISYDKAALELEWFRIMENEVIAEMRIESQFYYDPTEEE